MVDQEQLESAIAHLETQRAVLGDAAVDAAIEGLRQKLSLPELGISLKGERKIVTVMFADLSGFTALSENMDPESVRDMMNACFERLVPVVEKYGGTVDKFIGDEIMALFGAPVAHENDPERALRTALDILDALTTFNTEYDLDLGIHFGINTGLVIAGGIGTDKRQEYSVMGDAVNVASRLEDASDRGEILVGPDTYRLTTPLFNFENQEPIRVKGKMEPLDVYRLIGLRTGSGRARGLDFRGISSPLVGRDTELATINKCIERLLNEQGGIISIIGEAGVGKSRIMAEIRNSVIVKNASHLTWLEGHTLSFGQTLSYWPFQEILWGYAGITKDDSETEAWHKLESQVSKLFSENTAEILPYLAILLSLDVKGDYVERVKYLDGEAVGRQVFLASRRFFERLARVKPLVLLFDDLHWMDESSALLLEHLFPLVEHTPLLICCISRPDRQTPIVGPMEMARQNFPEQYTEVVLSPLTQTDSMQLVRNLLAVDNLPDIVREMIIRKAEGNPFFLEEIIRALIDAGAVVPEPITGRWRASAHLEAIKIPDTVQGMIMARVDRLEEDVKQTLRMAAVIGRSFLYRVLYVVAEADRQLDDHLVELQEIQFIREKQRIPELEYIFKHVLAQEVTYENILMGKRRELHARVGQTIETLFVARLEEFYSLLAYHYARAEVWEKAQEYLLKAGDQAGRMAADAEALTHYQQAMAAYARAFGDQWDPLQRAKLERKIGEAFFRRGEHQQALDHLLQALIYLDKPLATSRWETRLAILHEVVRQIGYRISPRLFLKFTGGSVSLALEEEARLYQPIGWIEAMTNPERFLLVSLRMLNVSEHSGFSYGVSLGSMALGVMIDLIPIFWLAEGYHRRALAFAEQVHQPDAISLAFSGLALYKYCLGELDAAIEYQQKGAKICRETGDLHGWGYVTNLMAGTLLNRGKLTQALLCGRDLVQLGQEGADLQVQCWGLTAQGASLRRLGQLDEAIKVLQDAVELAKVVPDHGAQISAGGHLGQCYLRRGELELALSALQIAERVYIEHGVGWGANTSLFNGLAEAYLLAVEQGYKTKSVDLLEKAHRACRAALKQGKACRPGLSEAMRLQGTYEWLMIKPAAARKWWRRSLDTAERIGLHYDLGMTNLEIGRHLGNIVHLERAEAIFTEIGAEWDLVQTQNEIADLEL